MAVTPRPDLIGALPKPALDEAGRLIDDLVCRRCGYSLRGLKPDGRCPECTTPIGHSIRGDLLEYSDPDWVARIARGGQILVASIALYFILPLGLVLLRDVFSPAAFGISLAIAKGFQVAGFWLATAAEQAMREREAIASSRRLARWGSIFAGAILVGSQMSTTKAGAFVLLPIPGAANLPYVRIAAGAGVAAIAIAANVALLMYARALALRIPDEKLWRQCNGVALTYAIVVSIRTGLDIYFTATGGRPTGGATSSPLAVANSVSQLATTVTMIWCVVLIFKFRDRLNVAATMARTSWARPLDTGATTIARNRQA